MPDINVDPNHNNGLAQPNHGPQLEASQQATILIQQIPLRLIKPNPNNRLITQDMIDEMADSLDTIGLRNALKVRPSPDGNFALFSGHIRRAGALKLGWVTIACNVMDITEEEAVLEGIWDNRQQAQNWLDDYEDIEALLRVNPNYTYEQLAKKLKMSLRSIERGKRLLKCLNPASRGLIKQNIEKTLILSPQSLRVSTPKWELTEDPVYRLTDLEDPKTVFKALQVLINEQLTGPLAKSLVDHLKTGQPLETFSPHQPASKSKTKPASTPAIHSAAHPSPLPAELADKIVKLFPPGWPQVTHVPNPSGTSQPGTTPATPSPSPSTPNANDQYEEPPPSGDMLAQSTHAPQHAASAQAKVYLIKDWLAGVKVIPQLKHKVEKGQDLTLGESMVLGTYRLGEGLHWVWTEMIKPTLKSLFEGLKKTLGKGLYNFLLLVLIAIVIWKAWPMIQVVVHPVHWIESKFHWRESKPEQIPAPVPTQQPVASTTLPSPQTEISSLLETRKVQSSVSHEAPENKIEKPASPQTTGDSPAPASAYQPSISFSTTASPINPTGTLYAPQYFESEIQALPPNCIVKAFPLTPDESMPGDLATSRLQDLTDTDKYTLKIGGGTDKILSVIPSNSTLTVNCKSTDAFGNLFGGKENQMVFFWEDVLVIHSDEIDVISPNKSPGISSPVGTQQNNNIFYQCSLIVTGSKNPLTIQCASADDLRHLVSTMEYFIRSSRLAHDTALAGMPFPSQGLRLNNNNLVEILWADSPMDKARVNLNDMLWSLEKNTQEQQKPKKLETQLNALTRGPHSLYLVSPSERDKGLVAMNANHNNDFNPKRHKVLLTI